MAASASVHLLTHEEPEHRVVVRSGDQHASGPSPAAMVAAGLRSVVPSAARQGDYASLRNAYLFGVEGAAAAAVAFFAAASPLAGDTEKRGGGGNTSVCYRRPQLLDHLLTESAQRHRYIPSTLVAEASRRAAAVTLMSSAGDSSGTTARIVKASAAKVHVDHTAAARIGSVQQYACQTLTGVGTLIAGVGAWYGVRHHRMALLTVPAGATLAFRSFTLLEQLQGRQRVLDVAIRGRGGYDGCGTGDKLRGSASVVAAPTVTGGGGSAAPAAPSALAKAQQKRQQMAAPPQDD